MTFVIDASRLLALHAEILRSSGAGAPFATVHSYSTEIASVENQILNVRAFAGTYRLSDERALAHLDPSIVAV